MRGQDRTRATWATSVPRMTPTAAATIHSQPMKPVRKPTRAIVTRTSAKARSTSESRDGIPKIDGRSAEGREARSLARDRRLAVASTLMRELR